jgi:hypothetical protein
MFLRKLHASTEGISFSWRLNSLAPSILTWSATEETELKTNQPKRDNQGEGYAILHSTFRRNFEIG